MKEKKSKAKKRSSPNPSCSSSSSSSCIDSANTKIAETKKSLQPNSNKRVRAKKTEPTDNSATSPKSRSSIYRGVTRHRWTGRYEAHLWDKSTWNSIQNKRGRQIYLGAYDNEEDAARTYDLAALKYWGPAAILNFPVEAYTKDLEEMQKLSKEEFLASLRRRSSGFSRGVSKYRGVARHHHNGRWEARIGRVSGNKYLYLGTYSTQEEAAAAYDRAAIEFRGPNAVTNFDISNYADKLKKIQPQDVQPKQEEEVQTVKQEIVPIDKVQQPEHEKLDHHHQQQQDENQQSDIDQLLDLVVVPSFNKADGEQIVEDGGKEMVIQQNIPKLELMVDPISMEGQEDHPWDLCLDTTGFSTSLAMPDDITLEKASELLGFLDDKGFEDDIECIFDGPFAMNNHELADVFVMDQNSKEKDGNVSSALSPSSSSSLSTITSVSSNV